jgi:DnaJ-class molecular chaperone
MTPPVLGTNEIIVGLVLLVGALAFALYRISEQQDRVIWHMRRYYRELDMLKDHLGVTITHTRSGKGWATKLEEKPECHKCGGYGVVEGADSIDELDCKACDGRGR